MVPRVENEEMAVTLKNGAWKNWMSMCKRIKLDPNLTTHTVSQDTLNILMEDQTL
jgi:hypothetical protein